MHPKYDGRPETGYDYGLGLLSLKSNKKNWNRANYAKADDRIHNTINYDFDYEFAKKSVDCPAKVTGYPVEHCGTPWSSDGVIQEVKKTEQGGLIAIYKGQASKGSSGSPVHVDSPDLVKLAKSIWIRWLNEQN